MSIVESQHRVLLVSALVVMSDVAVSAARDDPVRPLPVPDSNHPVRASPRQLRPQHWGKATAMIVGREILGAGTHVHSATRSGTQP